MVYKKCLILLFVFVSFLNAKDGALKVGVLYEKIFESKNEVQVLVNIWAKKLEKENSLKVKYLLYEDEKILLDDFFNKNVDAMIIRTELYFENRKEIDNITYDRWVMSRSGDMFEELYFLKNRDFNLKDITEKTKIYYREEIAKRWLDSSLRKENKNRKLNFIKIQKANKIILNPFFKKDVLSVAGKDVYNSMVELNTQLKNKLEIVKKSKPIFFRELGFTRKGLGEEVYKKMDKLHNEINNKDSKYNDMKLVGFLKLDRVFRLKDEDIAQLGEFMEEYSKEKK